MYNFRKSAAKVQYFEELKELKELKGVKEQYLFSINA